MTPNFWWWLGAVVGGLLMGAILFAGIYLLFNKILDWKRKKKMPKTKEEMLNPGKPEEISKKEVVENDREQLSKFREFEKLRQLATAERRKPKVEGVNPTDSRGGFYTESIPKRELLQDESDSEFEGTDSDDEGDDFDNKGANRITKKGLQSTKGHAINDI